MSRHFYGGGGRFQPAAAASLSQGPDLLKSEMWNYRCRFCFLNLLAAVNFTMRLICPILSPVRC